MRALHGLLGEITVVRRAGQHQQSTSCELTRRRRTAQVSSAATVGVVRASLSTSYSEPRGQYSHSRMGGERHRPMKPADAAPTGRQGGSLGAPGLGPGPPASTLACCCELRALCLEG